MFFLLLIVLLSLLALYFILDPTIYQTLYLTSFFLSRSRKKKLKASHAWLLCKVRMLLTNSLLFLPPFASLRLRHRRVASKEQKKIVLWICRTIMLNPRCETNKFSLFFRFCRCGHNAKGNGSPWCPISRKKSLHKKLFSFSFFLVGWITSAFCNIISTRGMCTNIYDGDTFFLTSLRPFLCLLRIHTRENYFPRCLMLHFDVFFRLRGFLDEGWKKWRKKFCKANGHFSDHRYGMKFAFRSWIESDFLILRKALSLRRRRGPNEKFTSYAKLSLRE